MVPGAPSRLLSADGLAGGSSSVRGAEPSEEVSPPEAENGGDCILRAQSGSAMGDGHPGASAFGFEADGKRVARLE